MSMVAAALDIAVDELQLRVSENEARAALERVIGLNAVEARARLRFGPGVTCERMARLFDKALVQAGRAGLLGEALVVSSGTVAGAEDIVRIRRKAHGVADWISSPTCDVSVVLRPQGLAAAGVAPAVATPPGRPAARRTQVPESIAELAVREALRDVVDPDLGVNVVDLGFVRSVVMADGVAHLTMTLTSQACPLTIVMERDIRRVLADSGTDFTLEWEWTPSWSPQDISEDGREQLRSIGFNRF